MDFFDEIYVYAWFTGFFLAGGLYFAGTKLLKPKPGGAVAIGTLLLGTGLVIVPVSYALAAPKGVFMAAAVLVAYGALRIRRGIQKPVG